MLAISADDNSKGGGVVVELPVNQFETVITESECQQPRNLGYENCATGGWKRKFFFDTAETICKSFWYQGCGGNANRFDSIIECRKRCLQS